MGREHRHIGQGCHTIDSRKRADRQGVGKNIGHVCPGNGGVVIREVAGADDAVFDGVIHIGLIPGGAVFQGAPAGGVDLVDPVGHDQGLGHGQRAAGGELAAAGAGHQTVFIAGLHRGSRPMAGGYVGEIVIVGCGTAEIVHAVLGGKGRRAQAQRHAQRQGCGKQFFHTGLIPSFLVFRLFSGCIFSILLSLHRAQMEFLTKSAAPLRQNDGASALQKQRGCTALLFHRKVSSTATARPAKRRAA